MAYLTYYSPYYPNYCNCIPLPPYHYLFYPLPRLSHCSYVCCLMLSHVDASITCIMCSSFTIGYHQHSFQSWCHELCQIFELIPVIISIHMYKCGESTVTRKNPTQDLVARTLQKQRRLVPKIIPFIPRTRILLPHVGLDLACPLYNIKNNITSMMDTSKQHTLTYS